MKNYNILRNVIIVETIIGFVLSVLGFRPDILVRLIFTIIYYIPLLSLLHLKSNDLTVSYKNRKIYKFVFWFIIATTVIAFVLSLIDRFK